MVSSISSESVPSPKDSLFPRAAMRAGQHGFYTDAKNAALSGKILFADAPTGIGKTAASISAALEAAIPNKHKVLFLTNRNSHHIQAIIETLAINLNRKDVLASMRPEMPMIRVIDKISKEKMCYRLYGKDGPRPPFLLCEIARCPYQSPKKENAQLLLATPMSAEQASALAFEGTFCAHQTAVLAAGEADLIICDYSYLFSPKISGIMLSRMQVKLDECDVIIDEAHNLPKRVRDMNGRTLDEETVKSAIHGLTAIRKLAADEQNEAVASQAAFIARHLRTVISPGISSIVFGADGTDELAIGAHSLKFFGQKGSKLQTYENDALSRIEDLMDEVCDYFSQTISKTKHADVDYDGIIALKDLSAFIRPAADFAWGSKKWGVFLKRGPAKSGMFTLRAILFDPAEISSDVFTKLHSAVLMSGTLAGKNALRELLGISPKRAAGLEAQAYKSPFDTARQPISLCIDASSRFADRGDDKKIGLMAQIIERAAMACHPNSFAVYYPSYEFMERVSGQLKLDGFSIEKEGKKEGNTRLAERKNRIDNQTKSPKPMSFHAVIGAKYNEGIDFRNNPFKLIIVAGFPYPKTTPSHNAYEDYLASKFSDKTKANEYSSLYPAIISAMQTIGRGIRQPEDWCYCLLIDDRFAAHSKFFSKPVVERMKTVKWENIEGDIAGFMVRMNGV